MSRGHVPRLAVVGSAGFLIGALAELRERRANRESLAHHALYSRGWKPGHCSYCGPRAGGRRVPVKEQGRVHVCSDCITRHG